MEDHPLYEAVKAIVAGATREQKQALNLAFFDYAPGDNTRFATMIFAAMGDAIDETRPALPPL